MGFKNDDRKTICPERSDRRINNNETRWFQGNTVRANQSVGIENPGHNRQGNLDFTGNRSTGNVSHANGNTNYAIANSVVCYMPLKLISTTPRREDVRSQRERTGQSPTPSRWYFLIKTKTSRNGVFFFSLIFFYLSTSVAVNGHYCFVSENRYNPGMVMRKGRTNRENKTPECV